jgi:hypothetical protein
MASWLLAAILAKTKLARCWAALCLSAAHWGSLSEPAAADRRGIGFGWLQNAWLLHARLKIHRGALIPVCG